MKPSPFVIRVLYAISEQVRRKRFTSPAWIAHEVFPADHPGWTRSCKCGPYGSTRGSGLVMMMGGFLGKLKHSEPPLVESWWDSGATNQHHCLSQAGEEMLKKHKDLLPAEMLTEG